MRFSFVDCYVILSSAAYIAAAVKCTQDTAITIPDASDDNLISPPPGASGANSIGSGGSSSFDDSLSDSSAIDANAVENGLGAESACNSLALIDGGSCIPDIDANIPSASDLIKRADSLDCATGETCISMATMSMLLCLDSSTGKSCDFKDSDGGKGNINTGTYTNADGDKLDYSSLTSSMTKTTSTTTGSATARTTSASSTAASDAEGAGFAIAVPGALLAVAAMPLVVVGF